MFETGQILACVGVGVIGLLRLLRAVDVGRNGSAAYWTKAPMDLLYRILEFVALTLIAVGLILALNTYRSWAHEDDIISIIAVTFMLIWASAPGIGESTYTSVDKDDTWSKFLALFVSFLSLSCCIGAYFLLGLIGARGKTSGDRSLVRSGISLIGAFGPIAQWIYNLGLKDERWMVRLGVGLLECTGWALFAAGALSHELDLETPVGFPVH